MQTSWCSSYYICDLISSDELHILHNNKMPNTIIHEAILGPSDKMLHNEGDIYERGQSETLFELIFGTRRCGGLPPTTSSSCRGLGGPLQAGAPKMQEFGNAIPMTAGLNSCTGHTGHTSKQHIVTKLNFHVILIFFICIVHTQCICIMHTECI